MYIKLLENTKDIREAFISRFVMSWEEFQVKQSDWIEKMAKTDYPVDFVWYTKAYMWDRMDPAFPRVSMEEALAFLREHSGPVLFMTEKGEEMYYQGIKAVDFIAEADARELVEKIRQEWYGSYRLLEQGMYDPNAILPDDLYAFDRTMKWCVVFTHETTDWEAEERDDLMKAAESRYCLICRADPSES